MQLKHTTKQLQEKQSSKSSSDANYKKSKANLEKKETEITKLNVSIMPNI